MRREQTSNKAAAVILTLYLMYCNPDHQNLRHFLLLTHCIHPRNVIKIYKQLFEFMLLTDR